LSSAPVVVKPRPLGEAPRRSGALSGLEPGPAGRSPLPGGRRKHRLAFFSHMSAIKQSHDGGDAGGAQRTVAAMT
jgi:hypothetical protein